MWGGRRVELPDYDFFFVPFFSVQQTTSGIGHRVKYFFRFFGFATNALNVRNNNLQVAIIRSIDIVRRKI